MRRAKPPTLAQRCDETGMTPEEAWEDLWEELEIAAKAALELQKQNALFKDALWRVRDNMEAQCGWSGHARWIKVIDGMLTPRQPSGGRE